MRITLVGSRHFGVTTFNMLRQHEVEIARVVVHDSEDRLAAADASWISGDAPQAGAFAAKTRYRQADSACELVPSGDASFELEFPAPQWAVTPGQSAVLYRGELCLGGGIIN